MKILPFRMAALSVAIAVLTLLGGCATKQGLTENDRLARYRAHAGAPVDSFHYFGDLHAWTPLGDEALVVWTRPHEAYLLDIAGPCPDLGFASAIGLTNQSGRVYARFDKVIPAGVSGGPSHQIPCHIREIRPIDVKGMRAEQREGGNVGSEQSRR